MIDPNLVKQLNQMRKLLLEGLDTLAQSTSFSRLRNQSEIVARSFEEVRTRLHPRLHKPFDGRFTTAIVGSSGHGKTTVIDEIFPHLSERGWLVTDVTDTTSQSLRIVHDQASSLDKVTVRSWSLGQIKELFNDPEAVEQNERDQIQVIFDPHAIRVEAQPETFQKKDFKNLKFGLQHHIEPFEQDYEVTAEQLKNERFIHALTIKEPSNKMSAEPVLHQAGRSYNALQLRAVVKDVTLRDTYANVAKWTHLDDEELGDLVFIDTPGLAVSSNAKDEALKHALAVKSNHIVLDLIKEDELDIIIHLVLCDRQSSFATLWKDLERSCGEAVTADLCERLILAINGTNLMFENKDTRRHIEAGDHFDIILEDNILAKMSPRGRLKPASICFLDSAKVLNGKMFGSYQKSYDRYEAVLRSWLDPGHKAHGFLKKHHMVDDFRVNVEALCDPEDRGQGHLLRTVVQLIRTKGERLLVRKHLIRTGLYEHLDQLSQILNDWYESDGTLSNRAADEALHACFTFLSQAMSAVEDFCVAYVDPKLTDLIRTASHDPGDTPWMQRAFFDMVDHLMAEACRKGRSNGDIAAAVRKFAHNQAREWVVRWGYASATLKAPERDDDRAFLLMRHTLATHAREVLHLLIREPPKADLALEQDPADREAIAQLIEALDQQRTLAHELMRQNGVAP